MTGLLIRPTFLRAAALAAEKPNEGRPYLQCVRVARVMVDGQPRIEYVATDAALLVILQHPACPFPESVPDAYHPGNEANAPAFLVPAAACGSSLREPKNGNANNVFGYARLARGEGKRESLLIMPDGGRTIFTAAADVESFPDVRRCIPARVGEGQTWPTIIEPKYMEIIAKISKLLGMPWLKLGTQQGKREPIPFFARTIDPEYLYGVVMPVRTGTDFEFWPPEDMPNAANAANAANGENGHA